jgi:biopolymer transport protein ExbD
MSTALPGSEGSKCDPNLTPLLDMVLQLIMFFMLCANFVNEQINEGIKLPQAIAAKALDKTVDDYHILNVDEKGVTTSGGQTMDSAGKVQTYMRNAYELDKARMNARGKAKEWEAGKGRSLVILRAHKDCTFKQVYDVMTACRIAGYSDIQLRAVKVDPNQFK